jgi:hypothetical protein
MAMPIMNERGMYMNEYTKDTLPVEVIECNCEECTKENCIHRGAYRRLPEIIGGLGLCPNLKNK